MRIDINNIKVFFLLCYILDMNPFGEWLLVALNSPKDNCNISATKQLDRYPVLDDDKGNPSTEDTRLRGFRFNKPGWKLTLDHIYRF